MQAKSYSDKELAEELKRVVFNAGRKWKTVVLKPSKKMLKKYPLAGQLSSFISSCTQKLQSSSFEYSFTTKVFWAMNQLKDFPRCSVCGLPITDWNVPDIRAVYKSTCSKDCERKLAQQNIEKSLLEKHGVRNAFQLESVKAQMHDHHDEWLVKCYSTHKANSSFKSSDAEDAAYDALKSVYAIVDRQHKTEEYPYCCDFYVPSEDLYVECNFSWTHGGKPFIETDPSCICQLEQWQKKNTKYYDNAVQTWTVRDVKKREIGKSLNWKEFWNLRELLDWLNPKRRWESFNSPNDEKFNSNLSGLIENRQYARRQRALKSTGYRSSANCTAAYAEQIAEKNCEKEFEKIQRIEFPMLISSKPTLQELFSEVQSLITHSSISTSARSLAIRWFHQDTFMNSRRDGRMSPYEFWQLVKSDRNVFKKLYKNRILHSSIYCKEDDPTYESYQLLLDGTVPEKEWNIGMSASGMAPSVSYFKPTLAKHLVEKYLSEFRSVYDPFSGLSGRLLGTLAAGKEYIGADVSDKIISESRQLIEEIAPIFINLGLNPKWSLKTTDSRCIQQEAECVMTCSPYGRIEHWNGTESQNISCDQWIDIILKNISARRYLFVTDQSIEKYKPFVREDICNRSHLGTNVEHVVVIDSSNRSQIDSGSF